MSQEGIIVLAIEGTAFVIALILVIFLIFRRIRIKKQENFEKRDN